MIWNLVGVATYLMEVTTSDEAIAALPEAQQALYAARPAWVIGAFLVWYSARARNRGWIG